MSSEQRGLEELLARFERGEFDRVAVGRALLQDPEWVAKVRDARQSEIRWFDAASLRSLY